MRVLTYLECGCAITSEGRRVYCPTCYSPPPPRDYDALATRHAALVEAAQEAVADVEHALLLCGEDFDHQPGHAIHHRVKVDIPVALEAARARLLALLNDNNAHPPGVRNDKDKKP